jgi:hypothetical protein
MMNAIARFKGTQNAIDTIHAGARHQANVQRVRKVFGGHEKTVRKAAILQGRMYERLDNSAAPASWRSAAWQLLHRQLDAFVILAQQRKAMGHVARDSAEPLQFGARQRLRIRDIDRQRIAWGVVYPELIVQMGSG